MNESQKKEIEKMSDQTERNNLIDELLRVDEWAFDAWEMDKESPLFLKLKRYENALKIKLEHMGVQLASLDLNF